MRPRSLNVSIKNAKETREERVNYEENVEPDEI
jgi:hypothetical protein